MQCNKDSDIVVVGTESCGTIHKGIIASAGVALAEKARELTVG